MLKRDFKTLLLQGCGLGECSQYGDSQQEDCPGTEVGARFFVLVQMGPGAQPHLSSTEVKERIVLYLYSHSQT